MNATHYIYLYGTNNEMIFMRNAIGIHKTDRIVENTTYAVDFKRPQGRAIQYCKIVTRRNIDKIYQSLKALALPYALYDITNRDGYSRYTNYNGLSAMLALKQRYALYSERDEHGKLPSYSYPGCYPIFYLDNEDTVLCPDCANDTESMGYTWLVASSIAEEGTVYCDGCSKVIFEDEYEESEIE